MRTFLAVPFAVTCLMAAWPVAADEGPGAEVPGDVKALHEAFKALQDEVKALREEVRGAPEEPAVVASPRKGGKPAVEIHGQLHNLMIFRNDSDFDRTPPQYNENGQTVGAFATVFAPALQWNITDDVRVFYEAEVGLNYWSKNNPDQENPLALDIFVLKHRQIFAEGNLFDGRLGFKVGYQYFTDTTALFLGHWIGAVSLWGSWKPGQSAGLFVGMVPDLTYEGLSIKENNFKHDIFVFGGRTDLELGPNWTFRMGVHALYDSHIVGRTKWLVAPNVRLEGKSGWLDNGKVRVHGSLDGVLQAGVAQNTAMDGSDQTILAWAAQGHLGVDVKVVDLRLNVMALSADDPHQGNRREGAFLYSSKSTSATIYMTEDEIRNWYDQLDRRMARFEGGFWSHRAGLLVNDLKLTVTALDWFRPSLIVGNSFVLEPENALGHRNVGLEGNLDLAFVWGRHLVARVLLGGMLPGKAAGALMNQIHPQIAKTDPMWWTEVALSVLF